MIDYAPPPSWETSGVRLPGEHYVPPCDEIKGFDDSDGLDLYPEVRWALHYHDLGYTVVATCPSRFTDSSGEVRDRKTPIHKLAPLRSARLLRDSIPGIVRGKNLGILLGARSQGLWAIDCDTDDMFIQVGRVLNRLGIQPWTVKTVHGGHYHLRHTGGEIVTQTKQLGGAVDILGGYKLQIISVPPSANHGERPLRFLDRPGSLPPELTRDQVREIREALGVEIKVVQHRTKGRMTELARQVIVEGKDKGITVDGIKRDYTSRSEACYAAALSLLGKGFFAEQIVRKFAEHQHPLYVEKGEAWFRRYLVGKAVREHGKGKQAAAWTELWEGSKKAQWARSESWPKDLSEYDKVIYLAFVRKEHLSRTAAFTFSERDIAVSAGLSRATVQRHVDRLVKHGLLKKEGGDRMGATPCTYSLPDPTSRFTSNCEVSSPRPFGSTPVCNIGLLTSHFEMTHDAFNYYGLGKPALMLWWFLKQNPDLRAGEIATRLNKTPRAVHALLKKLTEANLAEKTLSRRWRASKADASRLDDIAQQKGTLGMGRHKKEKFNQERQLLATALTEGAVRKWDNRYAAGQSTPDSPHADDYVLIAAPAAFPGAPPARSDEWEGRNVSASL